MAVRKVAFEFNPFKKTRVTVDRKDVKEARDLVADFVKESVLSDIGSAKSPVSGGRWKRSLTKEYAKEKGSRTANLELSGVMLDQLKVIQKKGNTLSLEIKGSQAGKADGNNRGTYGKKFTKLKNAREFIPRGKKTLTKEIWDGIKDILKSFKD